MLVNFSFVGFVLPPGNANVCVIALPQFEVLGAATSSPVEFSGVPRMQFRAGKLHQSVAAETV